jgi:hypothetical protein
LTTMFWVMLSRNPSPENFGHLLEVFRMSRRIHRLIELNLIVGSNIALGWVRKWHSIWGPRLTTRDPLYAYNSRSQETVVNPHNRVGISDYIIHYITSIKVLHKPLGWI